MSTLVFSGQRVTNQSLTGNTTKIDWDSATVNVGTAYSSGVFTPQSDGLHYFNVSGRANAVMHLGQWVNGGSIRYGMASFSTNRAGQGYFWGDYTTSDAIDFRSSVTSTLSGATAPWACHCQAVYFPDGELVYQGGKTVDQAVTGNVTAVTYPIGAIDPYSGMSSGVYTIPADGTYAVAASINIVASQPSILLYVDDSFDRAGFQPSVNGYTSHSQFFGFYSEGQTLEVRSNGTGTLNAGSAPTRHHLSIARLT